MEAWTFGIPTDGVHSVQYHTKIVDSILSQNIPEFEIIFATENNSFTLGDLSDSRISVLYTDCNKQHQITRKKNLIVQNAKYNNILLLHSYIYLDPNWYQEVNRYGYDWNVGVCKTINLDGKRSNDWLTCDLPRAPLQFMATDYDYPATPYHYAPGHSFCVKKDFALAHPFDESICWGGGEDIAWSRSINPVLNMKLLGDSKIHFLKLKNSFEKTDKYPGTIFWEHTYISNSSSGPS